MNNLSKKTIWGILVCYILLGFYFGSWRTEKIVTNDVIIYYEYLTAAFVFNDLTFEFAFDLPDDFDGEIWLEKGPEGQHFPKMTMGVAMMISPFYLIALSFNNLLEMGSYGYSSFFQFFIFLASLFYASLSLVLLRKILLNFFEDRVVVWTLISVSLATNLAYYICVEPGMSHIYSFFLFTALIYYTIKWHKSPGLIYSLILGILLGAIFLVRPTNAVVALIPVLYNVWSKDSLKLKLNFIKENWIYVTITIFFGALICSAQFIFWKYSTGNWFVYGYTDEGFFWNDPKIIEGLFSFRKGFFIYTPIMLLGFIGFLIGPFKKLRALRGATVFYTIINLYIVFSWWCWWYGGGFSQRALIESMSILSIFLAMFLYVVWNHASIYLRLATKIMVIGCVCLNLFQMKQYSTSLLHWDSMNFTTYKAIFGTTNFPANYDDLIDPPDYESAKKGER